MPASAATTARAARMLAGPAAGATVREIALAEEVDKAIVPRVLVDARIKGRPPGG
jgi:hypothetical protein